MNNIHWIPSCYTSVVETDMGDLLLHNSFMGALARIPASESRRFRSYLDTGIAEPEIADPALRELVDGGFFVRADLDEAVRVREILEEEWDSARLSMIILSHENCNFRCVYCYESFTRGKMKPEIVGGLKTFVREKARDLRSLRISWFGGEPLLGRDVIYDLSDSFLQSCERTGTRYAASMSTNGSLLTIDTLRALVERRVKWFQITLDGPEDIHNSTRKSAGGKGTYHRILDNLVGARESDEKFFIKIRVNFNEDAVSRIEEWLAEEIGPLFAADSRFGMAFHPIGKWGGPHDELINDCAPRQISPLRSRLVTLSRRLGFTNKLLRDHLAPHAHVCYAAKKSSLVVGTDGTIFKCSKEFENPNNRVGKLEANGQMILDPALWKRWTTLTGLDTSACEACSFYASCQSISCPLVNMQQGTPVCPMTREEYETLVTEAASEEQHLQPAGQR